MTTATGGSAELAIDAGFPGGNILVEKIEGDSAFIRQDLRDTRGDWFYWHFRVRGAAGRKLTFHFTRSNVIGVRGPAVSTDAGSTWSWLGRRAVRRQFGPGRAGLHNRDEVQARLDRADGHFRPG